MENQEENEDEQHNKFPYDTESLYTDQVFHSREELEQWAKQTCLALGYVIVTKRSNKNVAGVVCKVVLRCNRGGVYKGKGIDGKRKSGTKKRGCLFQLEGHYYEDGYWKPYVREDRHNHPAAGCLEGHAYARRLTDQEKLFIERSLRMNLRPKQIKIALRNEFPNNISTSKDIYNAIAAIGNKAVEEVGGTPMQVVLSLLHKKDYVHEFTVNPDSKRLENLFFMHPRSFEMFRAFPTVVFIDATYKTNEYNMPFVEIVGVTSIGKTFCVACAFLLNEQGVSYLWLLECLQKTLMSGMDVRVIVTDKDATLINACKQVFPLAGRILCRFHIVKNLEKHVKKRFKDEDEWGRFMYHWNVLIQSRTILAYMKNKSDLKLFCGKYPGAWKYIDENWLSEDSKKSVVSLWVDVYPNFGNYTTNRVEGEHALIKLHLNGKGTLRRLIECIEEIVNSQVMEIKQTFEHSRIVRKHKHNIHLFKQLLGYVSETVLDILLDEFNRVNDRLLQNYDLCGCKLLRSCGIPCACRLAYYAHFGHSVPLGVIHKFWCKLDFSPACNLDEVVVLNNPIDELSFEEQIDDLKTAYAKQPVPVKRSWLRKIKDIFQPKGSNVKVPAKQTTTRGRPIKTKGTFAIPDLNKTPVCHSRSVNDRSTSTSSLVVTDPERNAPARHSSYNTQTIIERSKSSGWVRSCSSHDVDSTSEFYPPYVATQHSQLPPRPPVRAQHSYYPPCQPVYDRDWVPEPNGDAEYIRLVPKLLWLYVLRIKNVRADGNCGFRAFAEAMGFQEDTKFEWVRQQMVEEYMAHNLVYDHLFRVEDHILESLQISATTFRPMNHWMQTPEAGVLISNRFGCVVHCLDPSGRTTCLPMFLSEEICRPHKTYTILNVGGHYVMVELVGNYPMPPVCFYWTETRLSCADGWISTYNDRLETWREYYYKPPQYCSLISNSCSG